MLAFFCLQPSSLAFGKRGMECCERKKFPCCAHCGDELEVQRAKVVLFFGKVLMFCSEPHKREFLEAWRIEVQ